MSLMFVNGEFIDVPDYLNQYYPPDPYGVAPTTPNVYVSPPGSPQAPNTYEDNTNTYFLNNEVQDDPVLVPPPVSPTTPTTPTTPSGGGGGDGTPRFAAPSNALGWMPMFNAPVWTPPPAFKAPTIEEARAEPGFQFALDEGRRQMEASAAAKGIGRTGGAVKHLIGYGQQMADTNYQNVFNRAGDIYTKNYTSSRDKFDRDYKGAWDEFTPRKEEAVITKAQGFAEWLAEMGIWKDIFNQGAD